MNYVVLFDFGHQGYGPPQKVLYSLEEAKQYLEGINSGPSWIKYEVDWSNEDNIWFLNRTKEQVHIGWVIIVLP